MYGPLIDEAHVCLCSASTTVSGQSVSQSVWHVMSSPVDLCNTQTDVLVHQICSFDRSFVDYGKRLFYVRAGVT